jgi:hypothetical protein
MCFMRCLNVLLSFYVLTFLLSFLRLVLFVLTSFSKFYFLQLNWLHLNIPQVSVQLLPDIRSLYSFTSLLRFHVIFTLV